MNSVIGCLFEVGVLFVAQESFMKGISNLYWEYDMTRTPNHKHEPPTLADKFFCPMSSTVIPVSLFPKSREACCSRITRQETKFQWTSDFKKDVVVGMCYCI